MIHRITVIYGDTDMMGVVYYANYLRYFESARAAWFRDIGRSYQDLEGLGVGLPVTEAHCRYRRPLRYEDVMEVDIRMTDVRSASLRFAYDIRRDGEGIASGYTVHACVGRDGRPTRIPAELKSLITPHIVPESE